MILQQHRAELSRITVSHSSNALHFGGGIVWRPGCCPLSAMRTNIGRPASLSSLRTAAATGILHRVNVRHVGSNEPNRQVARRARP